MSAFDEIIHSGQKSGPPTSHRAKQSSPVHDQMSMRLANVDDCSWIIRSTGVEFGLLRHYTEQRRRPMDKPLDKYEDFFCGRFRINRLSLESPITKGEGKYMKTIGYPDAFVHFESELCGWIDRSNDHSEVIEPMSGSVVIEAKSTSEDPMGTLRQIKTYLAYMDRFANICGLLWCPTADDKLVKLYVDQGLYVCRLPVGFEDGVDRKTGEWH